MKSPMAHINLTQMKNNKKIREWKRQILQKIKKVIFDSNRKKVFQLPSRGIKSNKYVLDNIQIDDSEEDIIDTTQKSRT